jgi:FtsH-binding integral membrane protein
MNPSGGGANTASKPSGGINSHTVSVNNQLVDTTPGTVLMIMEDRLRLLAELHLQRYANRLLWVMPASLFVTITLTLLTATFKDTWFVKSEHWQAVWFIGCVASLIWLVVVLLRSNSETASVAAFITAIKSQAEVTP